MSFLERQLFRLTNDPETDAAFAEKQEENRRVRAAEIKRLENIQAELEDSRAAASILPEDRDYFKGYFRERIAAIKESSMTKEQLDALNDSKPSQNYEIMRKTAGVRFGFKNRLAKGIEFCDDVVAGLKEKKQDIPPLYPEAKKLFENDLKWFNKTKFVTADVYVDRQKELDENIKKLQAGDKKVNMKDPDAAVEAEVEKSEEEREEFNIWSMIGEALGLAGSIIMGFLIVAGGIFGASLAANLNVYRGAAFRVLYAIYGFVFFVIVIPYVLGWRWWWNGRKPRFYALIPLIPYHLNNRLAQILFSWMSFKPDEAMYELEEWKHGG